MSSENEADSIPKYLIELYLHLNLKSAIHTLIPPLLSAFTRPIYLKLSNLFALYALTYEHFKHHPFAQLAFHWKSVPVLA